jgi:glycosyltransferase involved in cell wall biosynthesis
MSKILVLTNHSYMLYRFRLALLQKLQKQHQVVLSMPFVGHEDDFAEAGFRCIETAIDRRGVDPIADLKLLRFYQKLLREEKPDLVITYSIKPNIYGGLACRMAGIPYVANVQGLGTAFQRKGLAAFVTGLYTLALKKARVVFFENQVNAELFASRHIIRRDKIQLLAGAGVDLQMYAVAQYPENKVPRFLYLGRLMQEKGMDELFYAAYKLQEEGIPFVLDLVGFYEDAYKEQVEALCNCGIACFHGFQPDPRPFYQQADCVVLPSYHEGMSNVLLEAAAMGRPLITSDIPGCREAVEDGVSGLLCGVKDGQDLYEKMKFMAQLSPEERQAMGMAGRARMEQLFDKKAVVEATIQKMGTI